MSIPKDLQLMKIFRMLFLLSIISGCNTVPEKRGAEAILKSDREFSDYSVKHGMQEAFLKYFHDQGILLADNKYPIEGKNALARHYAAFSDTAFVLSWKPAKAILANSGELGFSYGTWEMLNKSDSNITKGTYVTIWQKDEAGEWKIRLDTGNEGLGN